MVVLLVFASSLMHVIEQDAQPEAFGNIPAAMWWAVVTLTTVGYGDVSPATPLGKLLGGMVTILGVGAFALPAGILASGFAQEIKQRDFIVSWNVVAKVPLFTTLDAVQIAEIAKLLRSRIGVPGELITHKGDPGDAMYFIVSGRVEVRVDPQPVQLSDGVFFGEIALIRRTPRTADVVAHASCQLLVLMADDFHALMAENPTIGEVVGRIAKQRLGELAAHASTHSEADDAAS